MVQFGKSAQCEKIAKLPLLLDTDTGMFTTLQADTTATSACNAVFVCSVSISVGNPGTRPGFKPGFFAFGRVRFFNLKTRVPGFPCFLEFEA